MVEELGIRLARSSLAWSAAQSVRTQPRRFCSSRMPAHSMRAWIACVALAVLLGIGVAVSQTRDEKPAATNLPPKLLSVTTGNPPIGKKEAPLLLSDDKPLLLDDEPGTNAPAGPGARTS